MTHALVEFGEFYPDPVDVEAASTIQRKTGGASDFERVHVLAACARGDLIALAAHNAAVTCARHLQPFPTHAAG